MKDRCECCRRDIPTPSIATIAGAFAPGWGLCRACWRLVGDSMRHEIIVARLAFRLTPHTEQALTLYWLWQIAVTEALFCSGRRAAA